MWDFGCSAELSNVNRLELVLMPRNTYHLAGLTFTSKAAIKKHIQQIVSRHEVGQPLEGNDFEFIYELLQWHPSASQKMGCGVQHFEIQITKPWNTKSLLLVRVDGTSTDFSYNVCLNPTLATQHVNFRYAARRAVWDQILEYKTWYFAGKEYAVCQLTGDRIDWDNSHVDHHPVAFEDLLDHYITGLGIDISQVSFSDVDNQAYTEFLDSELRNHWSEWHRRNAGLRVIKASENLRLGRHKEAMV